MDLDLEMDLVGFEEMGLPADVNVGAVVRIGYDLVEYKGLGLPNDIVFIALDDIRTKSNLRAPLYDGSTMTLMHSVQSFIGLQGTHNFSMTAAMGMYAYVRDVIPHPNANCSYRTVHSIMTQVMDGDEVPVELCAFCGDCAFRSPDVQVDPSRERQFANCRRCPFCLQHRYRGQSGGAGGDWAVPNFVVLFYPLDRCLARRMSNKRLASTMHKLINAVREDPATTTWNSIHDSQGWEDHVLQDPKVIQEPRTSILRGCGDGVCLFKDHTHSCDIFMDEDLSPTDSSDWSGAGKTLVRVVHPGPTAPKVTRVLVELLVDDDVRMYTQGAYMLDAHTNTRFLQFSKRIGMTGDSPGQAAIFGRSSGGYRPTEYDFTGRRLRLGKAGLTVYPNPGDDYEAKTRDVLVS